MKVANPIGDGGKDQLRFKTLGALTVVMGGMSKQTSERMRAGDAIEVALRKVAQECTGIDWEYVYNELGIKLDNRFDLSEIAGTRKIPVMPMVTVAHIITYLKANNCHVNPTPEKLDLGLISDHPSVPVGPYMAVVHETPSALNRKSRVETKKESLVEPTLKEWLLFQLGYVLCSGEPWGQQAFIRCGSSEVVLGKKICNPSVSRTPLPEDTDYSALMIACHSEDTEWGYLLTRAVTRVALIA